MARKYDSIQILVPSVTLSVILLVGLMSAGCTKPDPGSAEELALIQQGCSSSSRNDTSRKIEACINGTSYARSVHACDLAKRRCADEYDIDRSSDPMEEADVFASCWTGARAYMLQQYGQQCLE